MTNLLTLDQELIFNQAVHDLGLDKPEKTSNPCHRRRLESIKDNLDLADSQLDEWEKKGAFEL